MESHIKSMVPNPFEWKHVTPAMVLELLRTMEDCEDLIRSREPRDLVLLRKHELALNKFLFEYERNKRGPPEPEEKTPTVELKAEEVLLKPK